MTPRLRPSRPGKPNDRLLYLREDGAYDWSAIRADAKERLARDIEEHELFNLVSPRLRRKFYRWALQDFATRAGGELQIWLNRVGRVEPLHVQPGEMADSFVQWRRDRDQAEARDAR